MATFREQLDAFFEQQGRVQDETELIEPLRSLLARCEAENRVPWRLYLEGFLARLEDRLDDALRCYDALLSQYGSSTLSEDQEPLARALRGKGFTLGQQEKPDEAIAVYDEVVRRFGDAREAVLREETAKGLVNKGITLTWQEKMDEAIAVDDEVVRRFGDAPEAALREPVARALRGKGIALRWQEKLDEAIAVDDEVVRRFGDAPEAALREHVAMALMSKGVALGQQEKPDEAIAVYDEVVRRFGDAPEAALREHVAMALVNKGVTLGQQEKRDEEIAVFEEVVHRFGNAQDDSLSQLVSFAKTRAAVYLTRSGDERASQAMQEAVDGVQETHPQNLIVYLELALAHLNEATRNGYFDRMDASAAKTKGFLTDDSSFDPAASFLLVLREWNSYTPAIPSEAESDRGGGYYVQHGGEGIVIDPGYDFIQNFHQAGGRLRDIRHIIVTHAHDDHTAELEALLMLLHQANQERRKRKERPQRVSLYLSQGCQRKFSGVLPTRDDPRIERCVTLSRPGPGCFQQIDVTKKIRLTVLPAYHDDVLTCDTAVGLGFEFLLENGEKRRVIFTSDTGCYPRRYDDSGKPRHYDDADGLPELDTSEARGIYNQYLPPFDHKPDLLVAHIGSILKREFNPIEDFLRERKDDKWYYANHLGMLGTLTILDKLAPEAAIISEFGAELKGFHLELVDIIAQALHDKQQKTNGSPTTFVVPGDLTMVYYITDRQFLCHSDSQPHSPADLKRGRADDWEATAAPGQTVPSVDRNSERLRAYLFACNSDEAIPDLGAQNFCRNRFMHRLPHHRRVQPPLSGGVSRSSTGANGDQGG